MHSQQRSPVSPSHAGILPAIGTVVFLSLTLVTLPFLSAASDGPVQAKKAYVSAERPIHRILNGTALGSRPITPPVPLTATASDSALLPRMVAPALQASPAPDPPTRIPAPLASEAPQPISPRVPEPRRKPQNMTAADTPAPGDRTDLRHTGHRYAPFTEKA